MTDWLRVHGWDASAITMSEMLTRYGRNVPGDDLVPPTVFVSAQRVLTAAGAPAPPRLNVSVSQH